MARLLKLSNSLLIRIPISKRNDNLKNLKWISRNIRLSNSEKQEVIDLIKLKQELKQ